MHFFDLASKEMSKIMKTGTLLIKTLLQGIESNRAENWISMERDLANYSN
jgi:hypothetical protein